MPAGTGHRVFGDHVERCDRHWRGAAGSALALSTVCDLSKMAPRLTPVVTVKLTLHGGGSVVSHRVFAHNKWQVGFMYKQRSILSAKVKNSPVARRWQSAAGGVGTRLKRAAVMIARSLPRPRSEHHNRKVKSIRRTRAKVPGHVLDSCVACGTCSLRSERAVAGGRVKRRVGKNVRVRLSSITPEEVGTDGRFRARVDEAVRGAARARLLPADHRIYAGRSAGDVAPGAACKGQSGRTGAYRRRQHRAGRRREDR